MRIDLKKDLKHLYAPPVGRFVEVVVPPMTYLAVGGHGDPNTSASYTAAVESLYTVGYAVRAALRSRTGDDFVVGPLEGLWSSDNPADFVDRNKGHWDWTMLVPLPDAVTTEDAAAGLAAAAARKPQLPISSVQVLSLDEGRCLQALHVGSYDDEGPLLAQLHSEVMPALGVTYAGRHHEIYLSDPRRVAPEKLKTVLRQPVTQNG